MNSKLIGIGVIAVLLIGGGIFWVKNGDEAKAPGVADEAKTVSDEGVAEKEETAAATSGSIKDLLALGRAQQCTFSDTVTGGTDGVVYVANNKVRGDFTATVGGTATGSHMIVDGTAAYLWMDGQTTGFKTVLDQAQPSVAAGQTQQFDANTSVDYSCKAWSVDNAVFTLPSGVTFSDPSALLPAAPGQGANCAACDSAPADSRAQCRAALGCN